MTGATGFIGRHVVACLRQRGAEPLAVGRRSSAPLRRDLAPPGAGAALIDELQPDAVLSLAGYAIRRDERDPSRAERLNSGLPAELGGAIGADPSPWGGPALVHLGSGFSYGSTAGLLGPETRCAPQGLYATTKHAGEQAVLQQGGHRCVARAFTVFGPGESWPRLLPTLLAGFAADRPVPLSAGLQRRDFVFVADVAEALVGLLERPVEPLVNIASGDAIPVAAFCQATALAWTEETGRDVAALLQLGARPTGRGDFRQGPASLVELRRALGGFSSTPLAVALRRTIRAFRS